LCLGAACPVSFLPTGFTPEVKRRRKRRRRRGKKKEKKKEAGNT
jgi:hypothetical protein